ncbi:MAG: hypothetical protein N838_11195 [Thiohalocapsa sp. PB-PSB1]|nr:MAG: hypothetical protein N838_11195 [Thiohalocapsa sp. PB-PSB1]
MTIQIIGLALSDRWLTRALGRLQAALYRQLGKDLAEGAGAAHQLTQRVGKGIRPCPCGSRMEGRQE